MQAKVETLNVFPVKGMSATRRDQVILSPGEGVPGDRLFGFARPGSGFDPTAPEPLPKEKFVVLAKEAGLAGLQTEFLDGTLQIAGAAGTTVFDMNDPAGRQTAAQYLQTVLELREDAPPEFVSAAPHRFTDVSVVSPQMMNAVSLLNLETLRAFEAATGEDISPDRFRANIVFSGLPAWAEMQDTGTEITLGSVVVRTILRTQRCAATEVNPETAERDLKVPYLLRRTYGHMDMGVYAEVISGGTLRTGDQVTMKL